MSRSLLLLASFILILLSRGGSAQTKSFSTQSIEQLKAGIEDKHPSVYCVLAARLFESGKKDEATFWYYVGQVRYRVLLETLRKQPDSNGDASMFSSLSDQIGIPLNRYAFGNVPVLLKTIGDALDWDESHRNGFTSKQQFKEQYDQARNALKQMRDEIVQKTDSIKQQRTQYGLDNRE